MLSPSDGDDGSWDTIDSSDADTGSCPPAIISFFADAGLSKYAHRLAEATGAECVDDLRVLDAEMVKALTQELDLKICPAQRLRRALQELSDAVPISDASFAMRGDDCASAKVPSPNLQLEECIAICIDRSGSMGTPFREATVNVVSGHERDPIAQRTRMEAVKAMFYAFRDRIETISRNGSHQLGLFQYDSEVEQLLGLTADLSKFETVVDEMQKRGATAIYSSIIDAVAMLE